MNEECLICKAPLEYLKTEEWMECSICGKKEKSKTRCIQGHFVCDECHREGLDSILNICLTDHSRSPVEILEKMMDLPFCHMHGPEHHVMVGAALLTAYKNAGGELSLEEALTEMMNRGKSVPGGSCGFWGACGAGISTGMFLSIISGATPLTKETLESEFFQNYARTMIPMERYGKEGELDTAAIFLASPASTYVNGVILPVDGGYTSM